MSGLVDLQPFKELRELAKKEIASKNFDKAIDMYSSCLAMASGDPQSYSPDDKKELAIVYSNRGLCHSHIESNQNLALDDIEMAIQLDPSYVKSYYRKVTVLIHLGRLVEAKETNDLGLNIKPDDADLISQSNKINDMIVIKRFAASINSSWTTQLKKDPDSETETDERGHPPNTQMRQVTSGHFVPVRPTPLPDPKLIAYSSEVAEAVGFNKQFCSSSPAFYKFFSGQMDAIPTGPDGKPGVSFATGYALSIYGQEMRSNCPFGNGNGYGDGRAISIAEVVNPATGQRWEMQLKGAGGTPYRRGGDGRATLRSSVREFLASEAMHHLGISTTRALSLVYSQSEFCRRPSYSGDRGITEDLCAISCRVAASFARVGHVELFARRYFEALKLKKSPSTIALARDELRLIVEHVMFREFGGRAPSPPNSPESLDLSSRALEMLRESSRRIANLTAEWIRVGFCQGNFNSDNCLIGGRTMDYGPFGFIEKYKRTWNMWKDSGEHFSFRNQPVAGGRNFYSLAKSVALLLSDEEKDEAQRILSNHEIIAEEAVNNVFRQKLGLREWNPEVSSLFQKIDDLLEESEADYTLFWRQLSYIPERLVNEDRTTPESWSNEELFASFDKRIFYKRISPTLVASWTAVLRQWLSLVSTEIMNPISDKDRALSVSERAANVSAQMRRVSPKYVPREWMLVEAYKASEKFDFSILYKLQQLFENPYDEQPQFEEAYYRLMPSEMSQNGVTCMT